MHLRLLNPHRAVLWGLCLVFCNAMPVFAQEKTDSQKISSLSTEQVAGDGVWVSPLPRVRQPGGLVRATVWFDEQFLGDGKAYMRRAKEFAGRKRTELRAEVMQTLKALSKKSLAAAEKDLEQLKSNGKIRALETHWIVNGFSCSIKPADLDALKQVAGVKKIFVTNRRGAFGLAGGGRATAFPAAKKTAFDPKQYKHPWYIRYLQADKAWTKFNATGQGTLNIVHDFNFVFSDNVSGNLYRNPGEMPGDGKDNDGNGLIDDYHGYNFDRKTARLTTIAAPAGGFRPQLMHGFMCAAIICGAGQANAPYEFGIAPEARWAGVIASQRLEAAVEWAVEQGADTYSMSFSIPNLGEYRSHWRKVMEHGSFCGIYFVSGAGNFAQSARVPVQMRVPEDIPNVVFAAAGVQRNFSRTPFSSKGPVRWNTEHYQDGMVQKPAVCAFNMGLPVLLQDGSVRPAGMNGNSFAGPMFCGAIALMLSADPDLLPWDLREIITSTATDVAAKGVDYETGHGLINCYRAVKEVLRRKAIREGKDAKAYEGREEADEADIAAIRKRLQNTRAKVIRVVANRQAAKLGLKVGDILLTFDGQPIANQQQLQKAKAAAGQKKEIPVTVKRGAEELEFKFAPGPLGIALTVEFDEPTFQ